MELGLETGPVVESASSSGERFSSTFMELPAASSEKTWLDRVTGGPAGVIVVLSAVRPEGPPVKMIPSKVYVRVATLWSTLDECIEAARDDDNLS